MHGIDAMKFLVHINFYANIRVESRNVLIEELMVIRSNRILYSPPMFLQEYKTVSYVLQLNANFYDYECEIMEHQRRRLALSSS